MTEQNNEHAQKKLKRGITHAVLAYSIWGVLPVFWKMLGSVPPSEILFHRIFWSLVAVSILITIQRGWGGLLQAFRKPYACKVFFGTAIILSVNWLTYIWAVNSDYIVETSLGYFINPIISVLMGVLFLRESLSRLQWIAVGIASAGLLHLTVLYGSFPWIALVLAFTFGFYGLIRKTAVLEAVEGFACETLILGIPALVAIGILTVRGTGVFFSGPSQRSLLLILSGLFTATPLILFASAARRIKLASLGILQFLAPTMQLLIGVLIYNEPFPRERFIGFVLIWVALCLYTADLFKRRNAI